MIRAESASKEGLPECLRRGELDVEQEGPEHMPSGLSAAEVAPLALQRNGNLQAGPTVKPAVREVSSSCDIINESLE